MDAHRKSPATPLHVLDERLNADPSRVVLRPFHLGWHTNEGLARAKRLVNDVCSLSEDDAADEYQRVLHDFSGRHWQTEQLFELRYKEVRATLWIDDARLSAERKRLIGSYFCHEYTYAAAALMNPSIVPHPDQSGLLDGSQRFVMSLRAVGEGHISSIAFREGIAAPDGTFTLWPQTSFAIAVLLDSEEELDEHDQPIDGVVNVHRHEESSLSNTVMFPITEQQRNGLEDLRLVRFDHGGGDFEWIGTYTAYSGRSIRSELLRTRDFHHFALQPITGHAGRNKGMALFPERIDGRYAMVGRQDGKNLYLIRSDRLDTWEDEGTLMMGPKYPWEFVQIGNCGSPIRIDEGWLLFTHGVGAMRKYALGCALLDAEDPSKVLARTPRPVLTAVDTDRAGYVPNVVYTCGALPIGRQILVPYGISDSAVGFATASVEDILEHME